MASCRGPADRNLDGHLRSELDRLLSSIGDAVQALLQEEYQELWEDVVCCKPPWTAADLLQVLKKHWSSTFQVRRYGGQACIDACLICRDGCRSAHTISFNNLGENC